MKGKAMNLRSIKPLPALPAEPPARPGGGPRWAAPGLLTGSALGLALCALPAALLTTASAWAQTLYSEATFQALTEDRRAHRIGDVLTVLVYESATASASAGTTASKSSGLNIGVAADAHDHSAKLSVGDDSAGKGEIQRTGRVAAQLSVVVDNVLPNGDLHVAGRQEIMVNGEKQLLQLAGRVRPIDVSDANIVASTRIADAEITYVGDGVLAEKQRQGLVSRFFAWLGL
jgi:flagellar L-ring protein precursor FlgH